MVVIAPIMINTEIIGHWIHTLQKFVYLYHACISRANAVIVSVLWMCNNIQSIAVTHYVIVQKLRHPRNALY